MRKMDGLGRTQVSKYLPLGPNGDQSPIPSARAGGGERGRVTFLSPSQASGSLGMMEAEAVSFSRVYYLKISTSIFLVTLFRCWAGRKPIFTIFIYYTTCGSQLHLSTMCVSGMELRPWGLSRA